MNPINKTAINIGLNWYTYYCNNKESFFGMLHNTPNIMKVILLCYDALVNEGCIPNYANMNPNDYLEFLKKAQNGYPGAGDNQLEKIIKMQAAFKYFASAK